MRNYLKKIFIVGMVLGLAACAAINHETNHDRDYLQQARSVPETRLPPGMTSVPAQTYYPIPPLSMGPMVRSPSILPPGSQAASQARAQIMPQPQAPSIVAASSSTALVLNANYNQAWDRVGRGLRASGYKVMQQDKSVGGFFIVNLAETGGQLKATTPIYQVHLTPTSNNTTVTLLNDKNQPANAGVSGRILGALRQRL